MPVLWWERWRMWRYAQFAHDAKQKRKPGQWATLTSAEHAAVKWADLTADEAKTKIEERLKREQS